MKQLYINGELRELEDTILSVQDLLDSKRLDPRMVVVEYNGEIAPRSQYAEINLKQNDRLEIVQMTAGG
ncbi:MAG: sulfur carrier protein ThiS [Fimbriimonadia bacterium]|nr:sulfur carrier protein ThiS [Fimbriimonadia bacterium]